MSLLPDTSSSELGTSLKRSSNTSTTYKMNIDDERVKGTVADQLAAVQQAVYKVLNTERYRYAIYSWNYGVELQDLYGKPIPYCMAEIPRRITEALMVDDRIEGVGDFELSHNGGDILCIFTVHSVFGDFRTERSVNIA